MYTSDSAYDGENKFVIFIDVDNFKQINDTKDHAEGDALLINVCETINKKGIIIIWQESGRRIAIMCLQCKKPCVHP